MIYWIIGYLILSVLITLFLARCISRVNPKD